MSEESKGYAEWAVLELMGHVKLAGYVTEVQLAGFGMLHVSIPNDEGGFWEQHVPPASLYRMTNVSEAIARRVASQAHQHGMPVSEWDVRAEIRERLEREERDSIEKQVRRQVAIERAAEDRGLPPGATAEYPDQVGQTRYGWDDDQDDDDILARPRGDLT